MRMEQVRKLPIGIQDFEKLRDEGYLYVDKSEYIYRLVHFGKHYFLSRPRRFGKSLFLSTLRAYWEGHAELFEGLKIVELEKGNRDAWKHYPVFYFDFNKKNFQRTTALEEVLAEHLRGWEAIYGAEDADKPLEERFRSLLVKAHEQTGLDCVVLVDEYDKPLLEALPDSEIEEHNKAVFKGFFSTLKSYDHYLQFVFLTGVTKFSKVSIFSDLNHLNDISMNADFSGICGITQEELENNFAPEIEFLAASNSFTRAECLAELKRMYDGYHFSKQSEGIYNPFSLINAFYEKDFQCYWFETGTPTFLIKKLNQIHFDARQFSTNAVYASDRELRDFRADSSNPVPLMYQTGYLTIQDYDRRRERYALGYPNDEVKYAFIESLAPSYLHDTNGNGIDIFTFDDYIESGKLDGIRDIFISLFARLPYSADNSPKERDFQNVIYIVFTLLGKYVHVELHSAKGRADCVVETENFVYIFEFKRDASAGEALAQIESSGYAAPYTADSRSLYKIGVNFNSETRNLDGWEVHSA